MFSPCPCCGGKAAYYDSLEGYGILFGVTVRCTACGLRTAPATFGNTGKCGGSMTREGERVARALVRMRWEQRINPAVCG